MKVKVFLSGFFFFIILLNRGLAVEILLTVAEPAGIQRTNEPITSGIPLPNGTQTTNWSLFDGTRQIPLQVTSLPGRTPWILLDFQMNIAALSKKTLTLRDTASTVSPSNPLVITEDTLQITVTTGPLKLLMKKNPFNLFDSVWLDKDNNGSFSSAEQIISSPGENIKIVDSTSGQTFSGTGAPDSLIWEYRGPMRATLRVDGRYRNGSGEFIAYTTRIFFYAGQKFVKVEHLLRNSYQFNERHVKIRSATLTIGSGPMVRATRPGSVSWANGAVNFELVPTTLWNIDTATNNGMLLPDLSYHGATLVTDFSEGLSSTEQTNRANSARCPLFATASPSWYSDYGELAITKFGTLDDEKGSYQKWGWTWTSDQEPNDPPNPDYAVSWKNIDVHNDSEADDLWQNLQMYLRTGKRGYFDRAMGWARYYKWEYAFRTDGFHFAWDSDYMCPNLKVTRPLITIPLTSADTTYLTGDVKTGKVDVMAWGADHFYGAGLINYYYLTGDVDALEAATELGEVHETVYSCRTPGTYSMASTGMRKGARHLTFLTRLYEVTQASRWQTAMDHLAQLWIQSPDWDTRGFYLPTVKEVSPLHLTLLTHSFDRYFNLTGNTQFRDRIIAMAQWGKQYGLDPKYLYAGSRVIVDYPTPGSFTHNYFSTGTPTSFDPQPTIWMIDTLTRAYRFTGDTSYLERAKLHWDRASKARFGLPITVIAGPTQVGRFLNSKFTGFHLYTGNGDMHYADLLFYEYNHLGSQPSPDIIPPSTPTNLAASAPSSTQINLTWTASTDNVRVIGYKIYRNGSQVGTVSLTSFSDTGLSPSTTYSYKVASFDAAGNTSAQSVAASAPTQAGTSVATKPLPAPTRFRLVNAPTSDGTVPSIPANLIATAVSSSQINLTWNSSTNNFGIAGYKVYRNGSQISTATNTSYSDIGLSPSTLYSYTVAAFDAAGNTSSRSISVSVTTQAEISSGGNSILAGLPNNTWIRLQPKPSPLYIPRNFTTSDVLENQSNPTGRSYSGIHYGDGKLFYFGGGHNSYVGNDVEIYDITNNIWTQRYKPEVCDSNDPNYLICKHIYDGVGVEILTPLGRPYTEHTYQDFAYDTATKRFIAILYPGTWTYDPANNSWTALAGKYAGGGFSPGKTVGEHHLFEYDPNIGAFQAAITNNTPIPKGKTTTFGHSMVIFKDGVWSVRGPLPSTGITYMYSVYIPEQRIHIVLAWSKWWKYDAVTDTWTEITGIPADAYKIDSFDYDTLNKVIIGIQHDSEGFRVWAFDVATNTWTQMPVSGTVPSQKAGIAGSAPLLRYDPPHNVFIFLKAVGGAGGSGGLTETWAYRYKKNF